MSGFLWSVLSAADLTTYRLRTEQELPDKGQREYQPLNTWLENEQLKTALEERVQLIAEERVCRFGTLARAEWDEQMKEAIVTSVVGRHWQLFGHERKTRIWLYPEEALFLVECSCLELMHNGVAMSVQQAYCTLLSPNTSCTLNEYRTYAHLLRHGYRVLRHMPSTKPLHSDTYVQQKSEQVWPMLEVVDISDSKCRVGHFPESNSGACARKQLSTSEKSTSFNQRTGQVCAGSESLGVSNVSTEEADVTLVYEQKGPVIQSCLKPKGSLVLFLDSNFETQSSSRTVNVTPIDIDDNELEISYVNRNVSVTLSPQKKERQDNAVASPLETFINKNVVGEVLAVDTNNESSGSTLSVDYEEQSVTVEENCSSFEGNVQLEKRKLESISVVDDSNHSQSTGEVSIDYGGKGTSEGGSVAVKVIPESNFGNITANQDNLASLIANCDGVTEDRSSLTLQTVENVANNDALYKRRGTTQGKLSTSDRELITERKTFETVPSDDVVIVENTSNSSKSVVKSETEDVIEIHENSNDGSHIRANGPNVSGIEINSNSSKLKNDSQRRNFKKEDADVEIICDTTQSTFSKNAKGRAAVSLDSNQDVGNDANKHEHIAENSCKKSASAVCIKPDIEIVSLQESNSTLDAHRETAARKRSFEDTDVKEECSSAKKQFLNVNNWSQDTTEAAEIKPSSGHQINVINLEDDEARLTLAERKAILDAIPSIENKFTIHVQAPKQELIPPNVKPKQKDYYIQLWRLKADGFGGGPARNSLNNSNNFPMSQPGRRTNVRSEDDRRINPWLPTAMFRPQPLPMMGFGSGFLPHPMFAQAIMMAQSLAMAQSMAMNFNYHPMPHRFFRGRYLHRPYFRRGYKRRYNNNARGAPYHRNQGTNNNSYQFSRNSTNDSSESQSHPQNKTVTCNSKISDGKNAQVVIDIEDEPNEKLGCRRDSDDEVIECFEVVPSLRGSSRRRRGRTRGPYWNRYFAPSRKFRGEVETMHNEEEISVVGTADKCSHSIKHEQKSIEVTLSSDEELLDDSMSEPDLLDVVDCDTEVASCLQPENCRSVDTILSRLQVFQQGKKPRNMVCAVSRKQLRVTFDLYLPSMSFRKTTPGLPDYRIIVFSQEQWVSSYEQSLPTLGDISWALKEFDDCVPLLLARVDQDSIQFTLFARIDLPIAPGIVCDVL